MGCERATTDTVLWLYGEGSDDDPLHIAGCAECQAVVAEHSDVATSLAPVLSSLQASMEPVVVLERRRPARWTRWGASMALAAAALLAVISWGPGTDLGVTSGEGGLPVGSEPVALGGDPLTAPLDAFDLAMDDLDRELDELSRDLEML